MERPGCAVCKQRAQVDQHVGQSSCCMQMAMLLMWACNVSSAPVHFSGR
jgi:hypothetical protein